MLAMYVVKPKLAILVDISKMPKIMINLWVALSIIIPTMGAMIE